MPKQTRYEQVLQMMLQWQQESEYIFLGVRVCRQAFMQLTGLGAGKLTMLRAMAATGKVTYTTETQLKRNCGDTNPKRNMDARSWIEVYGHEHGEQSPMSGVILLPAGRKSFYHMAYLNDRSKQDLSHLGGKAADINTFMTAWRQECWHIVLAKSESMFTRCGVCEFLKDLLDTTPRNQDVLIRAVRARLGEHYSFQAAQRLAQGRLEEACVRSGGTMWSKPQWQSNHMRVRKKQTVPCSAY